MIQHPTMRLGRGLIVAGLAAVTVIEAKIASGTSPAVTFDSIPTDGERIVLLGSCQVGGATLAMPGTFTSVVRPASANRLIEISSRVASSEGSATYTCTTNSTSSALYGLRLSACSVGSVGDNIATSVSALASAATPISVTGGAFVLGGWLLANTSGGSESVNQSFTLGTTLASRAFHATHSYPTGAGSVSPTLTWTTSRNATSVLAEFRP